LRSLSVSLRESFPKENEPKTLEQIERLTDEIGKSIKDSIQRDAIEQQGRGLSAAGFAASYADVQTARGIVASVCGRSSRFMVRFPWHERTTIVRIASGAFVLWIGNWGSVQGN